MQRQREAVEVGAYAEFAAHAVVEECRDAAVPIRKVFLIGAQQIDSVVAAEHSLAQVKQAHRGTSAFGLEPFLFEYAGQPDPRIRPSEPHLRTAV